jgi:single-stranded-DNA-specific exonuclease
MTKQLVFPPTPPVDVFKSIKEQLGIRDVFVNLLIQRGVITFDDARKFFRPEAAHFHDPFFMKDMDKAVQRIGRAMERKEKILIYGDYDVDGTTSVAAMFSFFQNALGYHEVQFYIPDRYTEGYGVSFHGVEFAREEGFSLIITLDCGVKSADKISKALDYGIDFIVCDHHLPGETLPPAFAMLNPKQADCSYPFKELAGCGIGFKLMQALCIHNNLDQEAAYEFLDLAAISACADIVPLTGENRTITALGLERMKKKVRPGIRALLDKASFRNPTLSVEDIVFVIAPRINAAGRLKHGKAAVELLIADEAEAAGFNAEELNTNNKDRKELDKQITREALSLIENDPDYQGRRSTVVFQSHWHKGVVGIVASRLIEVHYKPTVVLTESNGKATGSARTVEGFDLYAALEECIDLFENFGGHMHAAGLTMRPERVDEFVRRFDESVKRRITADQLTPVVKIDAELSILDVTDSFFRLLRQFAPFGPGNMNPVFLSEEVCIYNNSLRIVGENHLQMQIYVPGKSQVAFKAIAFKQAHRYEEIQNSGKFRICYSVNENVFRPSEDREIRTLDLEVKEIVII